MNIAAFLSSLREQSIELRADNDKLVADAPKGALTADLGAQIREHKEEILAFLIQAESLKMTNVAPLQPISRNGTAPLSFAQQRFWFVDQMTDDLTVNNIPEAWQLTGQLDIKALEQALNEVVARHEILRTQFEVRGPEVVQSLVPEVTVSLSLIDLTDMVADKRQSQLLTLLEAKKQEVIELDRCPLWKTLLIRLDSQEHVLFFMPHHIIWDGWSWDLLCAELTTLYTAFSQGKPSPLEPLPIQYADFSLWQRSWVAEGEAQRQLAYWTEKLSGSLPILQLPADQSRPAIMTYQAGVQQLTIPPYLTTAIKQVAQTLSVTPFMVYLAVLKVLLYRYSNQEDIIVGSPIQARTLPNVENIIGPFVNTVALRTQISPNVKFADLMKQVRTTCLEAYACQDIPFNQVVDSLALNRDPSRTPIYQALFSYENVKERSAQFGALTRATVDIDMPSVATDISVSLIETDEGVTGYFEYYADVYHPDTIERMAEHYRNLLDGVVDNVDQSIGQIPLINDSERTQLLRHWNKTEQPIPLGGIMHHLIEAQVARVPDKVAVECEGQKLTYRQLDEQANQLAHYLQKHGVVVGDLVGIYVERSLEMVVGLLGILKVGGTYVPLDPAFPPDRIAYMIEDANMSLILTQERLVEDLPAEQTRLVRLDDDWPEIALEATTPVVCNIQGSDLAYVIYTSGSTGKPKGVQLPHQAVSNFLVGMSQQPSFSERDTLLAVTTLSFDIAVLELYLPLSMGGKVVIASRADATDGRRLIEMTQQHQVTVMQATPTTWRLMLGEGWVGNETLKILCGGEAMPPDLAETLVGRCRELWNMYGPTETTVWSTVYQIKAESAKDILIGGPIANTEIYILDEHLQPTPLGVVGTLYIGGEGLAAGYLGRSELTSEKFIPHPFKTTGRIYNTGDLARYRANGQIECLGRVDHQIKIRGYRIELGEIEAVMAQFEGIHEAAVTIKADNYGEKQLVGYLTEQGEAVSISELRSFLKHHLPDYMVPIRYVRLEEMPLTPNRKIDRKALPEPVDSERGVENTYIAPTNDIEQKLVALWEQVLDARPVSVTESFFDLGGHSLLAARLFHLIEQALQKKLPLAALFQAPTIRQLATLIRDHDDSTGWSSLVPIQTQGTKTPIFLVHPAGGNVLIYRDLAHRLGADQPVYGLQSQGLDGKQPLLTTAEAMAERYVREIKSVQPEGPYRLGGYCLGGTIAYEMAQQLYKQGDEVETLALFETYNWINMPEASLGDTAYFWLQKSEFHIRNFLILDLKGMITFLAEKIKVVQDRRKVWQGRLLAKFGAKPSAERDQNLLLATIWEANDVAGDTYVPKPYPGRITFFQPRKEYALMKVPEAGWEPLATKGVKACQISSFPAGMLVEPFVDEVAESLKEILDESKY